MIPTIHDETSLGGDRTESSDDETVPDEIEVIEDVLLEPLDTVGVIVVGEISDFDVGPGDEVLQESETLHALERETDVGRWASH